MNEAVIRRAEVAADHPEAAACLARLLGPGPFALVITFLSPDSGDAAQAAADLSAALAPAPVIGCTTAGEIGAGGYAEGLWVAVGLPVAHFSAQGLLIADLEQLEPQALISDLIRARGALAREAPGRVQEFAFLLVDGLSSKEDALTSALAPGLGGMPLFGGSAADGARFLETFVFFGGQALRNAAVLALVRTDCPVRVFRFDHFRPSDIRMVVTRADPLHRRVQRINAEPAAAEYARLLGKDPVHLTPFTFAAHPVVVRVGGHHHVRSIRQVDENGDLIFFSAIDEGLVLTLAEAGDMVEHLSGALESLAAERAPAAILACDCVLRRMEAQEKQVLGRVSALLRQHGVTGFSTYGEQQNALHVNQTLTGVAIYPPEGMR